MPNLMWLEISAQNLAHNVRVFRKLVGKKVQLLQTVKANAYGHGLIEASKIFLQAGADWLGVNALFEVEKLSQAKIRAPVLVLGYTPLKDLPLAGKLDARLTVYNFETIRALGKLRQKIRVHIKVETGVNRQGVLPEDIPAFVRELKKFPNIIIEGISTHFANIEDTTDHSYARFQMQNFEKIISGLERDGVHIPLKHCANSAAVILWPNIYFNLVRVGVSGYGMWPSTETFISAALERREKLVFKPALTWKTVVAQVKNIPAGAFVGYGCTFQAERDLRIVILPVGYYDGYDRSLSNKGYVLIRDQKARLIGRVCMNMIMADVTDIPRVQLEDEVVLLGKMGREEITAEQMGEWAGTINYEVVTRIREGVERKVTSKK